jgi:hypothetical protein
MHGCGGRESKVLADMGGSAAEEEKRRFGRTWFDRIWNPLFAMKRCRPLYDIRVQYMLRFGFEVLFMMFAKSPPVITSPSWELDFH